MGSETISLPIIDFSKVKQDNVSWESVKTQVREALEQYGCFEATFDQITSDLKKSLLDGLKQLFDLPVEIKSRNKSDNPYHGYLGKRPLDPLYESLGIEQALSPGQIESFIKLFWPQGNPSISNTLQSYSEQIAELNEIVRRMAIESLGLEKYMDEHIDTTTYIVRSQRYDAPHCVEPIVGASTHTDKSIITILYQNDIEGLEVQTKDGQQWIPVGFSGDSFVVMIGEAFSVWTNGRLHAPAHKVMMSGDEERYSIGVFSIPKEGCIIEAREEMVDEEHPSQFKPFDYYGFFKFFNKIEADRTTHLDISEYNGA